MARGRGQTGEGLLTEINSLLSLGASWVGELLGEGLELKNRKGGKRV